MSPGGALDGGPEGIGAYREWPQHVPGLLKSGRVMPCWKRRGQENAWNAVGTLILRMHRFVGHPTLLGTSRNN